MILKSIASLLYNLIVFTSFVNGYIYFAAHLDDLENVAKKLAPDAFPNQRSKTIVHEQQRDEPKEELRVDYYEELEPIVTDYRDGPKTLEGEAGEESGQRRKVSRGPEPNIDDLAKKIKDRVLKELAEEFVRMKEQRKNKHAKQRKGKAAKNRFIKVKGELKADIETTPTASVIKREKNVRSIEEEQVMPTTNKLLIRQILNTRPKVTIEEEVTEIIPITVKSEEIEVEKIDIGTRNNDSYEYYVVPPKDEVVFESAEAETTTPTENMVRYQIQSNADTEMSMTTKFWPQQKVNEMQPVKEQPNYWTENVMRPTESRMKVNGNDDTYILYEMESEEGAKQTQSTTRRTTKKTTRRPTQKIIRMTRSHYSMTSPDYYASLPTIAERYDFNEPIPTRDRVRSI